LTSTRIAWLITAPDKSVTAPISAGVAGRIQPVNTSRTRRTSSDNKDARSKNTRSIDGIEASNSGGPSAVTPSSPFSTSARTISSTNSGIPPVSSANRSMNPWGG